MQETTQWPFIMTDTASSRHSFLKSIDAIARRGIDIFGALFGLLVFSPLFLLIAWKIKRDSPGPVFYRGRRLGKDNNPFNILKFRTMYERSDSYAGPRVTATGDSRITPLGQWLRDTKINELPQFWNVLVGDMSLVGPRPEDPELAITWPTDIRKELLSVRPGMTSPASVVYRNEEKMLSGKNLIQGYLQDILPSKLRLDRLYLRNRTVLSDLDVIFMTVVTLLPRVRQQGVPQHLLYWGPLARVFSRYGSWFVVDLFVALASTWTAGLFWRLMGPLNTGIWESLLLSLGIAIYFSLINTLIGLNNISWSKAGIGDAALVLFSGGSGTIFLAASDRLLFGKNLFPTGMVLVAGALAMGGFVIARYRERVITSLATRWLAGRANASGIGERVLIVGAGEMGSLAIWLLTHGEFSQAFQIAGIVDDDPRKIGMIIEGVKILGTTEHVSELVKKQDIGIIVFAINKITQERREQILGSCETSHIKLVLFPDMMEVLQTSLLPKEQAALLGALHNHQNGVLARIDKTPSPDWISELEQMLAARDIHAAQALLGEMRKSLSLKEEVNE